MDVDTMMSPTHNDDHDIQREHNIPRICLVDTTHTEDHCLLYKLGTGRSTWTRVTSIYTVLLRSGESTGSVLSNGNPTRPLHPDDACSAQLDIDVSQYFVLEI